VHNHGIQQSNTTQHRTVLIVSHAPDNHHLSGIVNQKALQYCKTLYLTCVLIVPRNVEILLHFNLEFSQCSITIYQALMGKLNSCGYSLLRFDARKNHVLQYRNWQTEDKWKKLQKHSNRTDRLLDLRCTLPMTVCPCLTNNGVWRRHRTWYQCVSGCVGAVDSQTVVLTNNYSIISRLFSPSSQQTAFH